MILKGNSIVFISDISSATNYRKKNEMLRWESSNDDRQTDRRTGGGMISCYI